MEPFADVSALPARLIWQSVTVRAVDGERLTLGVVELDPNAVVPEHRHDHEQLGLVLPGSRDLAHYGGDVEQAKPVYGAAELMWAGTRSATARTARNSRRAGSLRARGSAPRVPRDERRTSSARKRSAFARRPLRIVEAPVRDAEELDRVLALGRIVRLPVDDREVGGKAAGADSRLQASHETIAGIRCALDQRHRELVAAHPAGEVRSTPTLVQQPRDLTQDAVALGMPMRVVDRLEVVDVEEDEGEAV